MRAAGSGRPARRRLPRRRRLTRSREIRHVLGRGRRSRTSHLDVFDSASPVGFSRVGWIVPRHGRSAVRRNRLKRRIREVLRVELLPRLEHAGFVWDVLVRTRPEAYHASFGELQRELVSWVERRCSNASSSA